MSSTEQAQENQIKNIQKRTEKSLPELEALIKGSGLSRHSELRNLVQQELGLGYGDANSLVHYILKSSGSLSAQAQGLSTEEVLAGIYSGAKAALLPIHRKLMEGLQDFGDFEISPKKGYVSLRRKKQFAMLGPASNTRVDVGINHKSLPDNPRLLAQPAGGMCNYIVRVTSLDQVDTELVGWLA